MKAIVHAATFVLAFTISLYCSQKVIAQIAPGVTQSAAQTATITGTVIQNDGTPVAGANLHLNGSNAHLTTVSDAHGLFVFTSVPYGTYRIDATVANFGAASRDRLVVQGDITVAIQYAASNASGLKTIAQVSTQSAGAHINVTSASISSISPSEYAFQGNDTWKGLFAQIPGVAASGYSNGGNSALTTVPGSPQAPVILSLNGALPYETSTTLDGMPLEGISAATQIFAGGGVDLSNMPLNAFNTADVVRGPGANAPSIVDSVGGSFVLHGPGQVDANHFEFSISNDPYGGTVSNAKIALHLGRLSATFIYGVNDSPGPLGTTNNVMGVFATPATIDGQTVQGSTVTYNANGEGIVNCYCVKTATLQYCCIPQSTAWTAHSGAADLSYKVTPSITAEVFYAGSVSRQPYQFGYELTEFSPTSAVPAYSGSLPVSPPGQATYAPLFLFSPLPLNNEASSLLEEKLTAFVGKGVLRLAALQNNTFFYQDSYCSFANGEYKLWGTANVGTTYPGTPVAYNGTPENLTFPNESLNYHTASKNRDLLGSYAVQVGSASSAGLSFTTSYYNAPWYENELFGSTPVFSVGLASAASETTNETRLHFDTEISDKLSLGLSWYFAEGTYHLPLPSNPNSWGNSVFPYSAPRFGAVWQASPNIAVRASAGGGYALPALYNLTGTPITNGGTYYFETIANPNIKPEETFGFDVGTDVRFRRDTILSFDLYRTNLYGQFFTAGSESTLNNLPLFITEFGNIGTSLMEGINLDVRHDVPSGYYWRGTAGFTRGYVVSVPPGFYNNPSVPCTNCANQGIVPGPNFNSGAGFLATVPYASASAELGYRWHPGKYVDLSSTYYGNNNIYYAAKAFVELDAHAGYPITRNVSLLATFRNITGVYDQSIALPNPSYAIPVISGATGYYSPGAAFSIPYGPRSVVVTVNFKY